MSLACVLIWVSSRPSSRSAALFMMFGSVETPIVNVEGTLTRMFFFDSALLSSMSIVSGSRVRKL